MLIYRILFLALLFLFNTVMISFAWEEAEQRDGEYSLDLLTYAFDYQIERLWRSKYNGFRCSFGSMNVEELYINQEFKMAIPLSKYMRLLATQKRYESLEEHYEIIAPEIELRFWKQARVSWVFQADWHKRNIDTGFIWKYETAPQNFIHLYTLILDGYNNASYSHSTDKLHIEEIRHFNKIPYQFRLKWDKHTKHYELLGDIAYTSKWNADFHYETSPEDTIWGRYERSGEEYYHYLEIEYFFNKKHSFVLNWELKRELLNTIYRPKLAEQNINIRNNQWTLHSYYVLQIVPEHYRLTIGLQSHYEHNRESFPNAKEVDYDYRKQEILPYIWFNWNVYGIVECETGYILAYRDIYRDFPHNPTYEHNWNEHRTDNRIKLNLAFNSFHYQGKEAMVRFYGGIDLDKRDSGQFGIWDHGAAQFMILF